MIDNYLQVLEDSLNKKLEVLHKLEQCNGEQEQILKAPDMSYAEFDRVVDEKQKLIRQLENLDEGFETLYERIREQLLAHKDSYRPQIGRLQSLIARVTQESVAIQAQEERNKRLVETFASKTREEMRAGRKNSKAAFDYYKNMNMSQVVAPQFMDKKK